MLFYRAALPLSRKTLTFVSGIIRRHRKSAGFAVGTTTAWRYVEETMTLLAARAPHLRFAGRAAVVSSLAGYSTHFAERRQVPPSARTAALERPQEPLNA